MQSFEGSGGVLGGGCFAAGTTVHTPNGLLPIELIKVGDSVYCFDASGETRTSLVTEVSVHAGAIVGRLQFWGGEILVTPNHHFLSELGSFQSIDRFEVDDILWDWDGGIRPFEEFTLQSQPQTVYNFRVAKYHTYFVGLHGIRVHNGGGGKKKQRSPVEQSDTLRSSAKGQVLELLCEGEIEGLATGDGRSIFLDRTPVQNADLSFNFGGIAAELRAGTQIQTPILGFGDSIAAESQVGIPIKFNQPQTRTIQKQNLDAVKIRIGVPSLQEYRDNGDVTGASVHFRIWIKEGGGSPFILRLDKVLRGKASSQYEEEYLFPVNNNNNTVTVFQVRVERISADANTQRIQNELRWQSYTELIFTKFSYPNSALIALQFNAEQFSSIPARSYDVKGLRIKIPTNAIVTPDGGLNYTGAWNGQFYVAWCADPVWILYDLITNNRYGAGEWIKQSQVDKWSFYTISQYCNQYIPDGYGGWERRYLCNLYIQQPRKAWELINAILSIFRGMAWWGDGTIYLSADMPTNPTKLFTQADVVDGQFNYVGSALRSRHTIALVSWADPDDFYREAIEPVVDPEGLALYGARELRIQAVGCTSRGQAYRAGRWALASERIDDDTVSFKATGLAAYVRPGEVISIADAHAQNYRGGGRITKVEANFFVTLDAPVELAAGYTWSLSATLPDGSIYTSQVYNTPGTHARLQVYYPNPPVPGANWILQSAALQPTQWRVLAIAEEDGIYAISAIAYNPSKYNAIELGWSLDRPQNRFTLPQVVAPPVAISASGLAVNEAQVLAATWSHPDPLSIGQYLIEYQRDGGLWQGTTTIVGTEARIDNVPEGTYRVRVAAIGLNGNQSAWAESTSTFLGNINIHFAWSSLAAATSLLLL